MKTASVALLFALILAAPLWGAEREEGFVPLFNGKDLKGWVNVNCAPGTFYVKDGEIITTGKPTGFLRTDRQYENFIAEFEWMHVNKKDPGNSGFFVWADALPALGTPYTRAIEVQVLVNLEKEGWYTSHGDVFSIHGAVSKPDRPHPQGWARCLPNEKRCKGGGEWNHYRVVARDGVIKLHVNGKEVSGLSACRPRKGYLALESEGAECHFRNLKIKELPSTNPRPEEVAEQDRGFTSPFNGLDLSGWKAKSDKERWHINDGVLYHDGKGESVTHTLWGEKEYGDIELVADYRLSKKGALSGWTIILRKDGNQQIDFSVNREGEMSANAPGGGVRSVSEQQGGAPAPKGGGEWRRLRLVLAGGKLESRVNEGPPQVLTYREPQKGILGLQAIQEAELRNLFVRQLKK
jgi:hypothetical protein